MPDKPGATQNPLLLVSDVHTRKGFDVYNILHQHYGFRCLPCASRDTGLRMPWIFLRKVHRLRSDEYRHFVDDLSRIVCQWEEARLVYVPVSEHMTDYFYRFVAEYGNASLAYSLPAAKSFNICRDKFAFQNYCERAGFPVPASFQKKDLPRLRNAFRPLVLKPRSGEGSVGIHYIESPTHLAQLGDIDWQQYVLQEKVAGNGQVTGVFFLYNRGEVVSAYAHQRLRTFPSGGGVTVYSRSVDCGELLELGDEVLRSLEWHGLAMLEFIYDQERESWRIIELNPRLWGSVLLSAFNGSEMLRQYVQISLGEDVTPQRKQLPQVYIRWIYPFDLLNWLKGTVSAATFFRLNLKNTAYINITYSTVWRTLAFWWYFTFNFNSIKRFIKKLI